MRIPLTKSFYMSAAAFALFTTPSTAIANTYKVTVQDNGHRKMIRGFGSRTVGGLLRDEGLNLNQNMLIIPKASTPVQDGMTISIWTRRTIWLNDGGKKTQIDTYAQTVDAFLQEQHVELRAKDQLNVSRDSSLSDGQTIEIVRRDTQVTSYFQQIPYHTTYRYTDKLSKGQIRVIRYGVKGKMKVTRVVDYVNGNRVHTIFKKEVINQPKNRIVEIGTRKNRTDLPSRLDSPGSGMQPMMVIATAYTAGGQTATGWAAQPGVVAVDPSVIPLGSKLYIPGRGVVYAEDTGGAIVGNRIDICMNGDAEAMDWGVKTITVYVLNA